MVVTQGDIYWVDLGRPTGSEPGYVHPYVVVQNDDFNKSKINTVVICSVTSNLRRASAPGNILLEQGEGGLPKRSVVNISQIYTVDRSQIGRKIGALSPDRIRQILDGLYLLFEPYGFTSWTDD